ncbi:MAG: hypothetical protein KGZ87_03930 [Bacteroidetes bacterium]|jgi:nucleoside-diphosphate-sugar epimerase|nr:hypothetical protein [Bacteroidota bacterium]
MQTISIFGCGWLGEPLAEYLLSKGFTIKGSTTTVDKIASLKEKGITPYLMRLDNLSEADFSFFDTDILIVNIPSKDYIGFKSLTNIIEGSNIKKVLFVSSTSVYKDNNSLIFEHTLDSYSDSPLLEIEDLFTAIQKVDTTILRFGGLFGGRRKPGNFFSAGYKVSQPDAHVNMIHLDDCIEIIYQIIDKNSWNQTYNACADLHPTKRMFYTKATEIVGKPAPNFIENEPISFKIISNDKIKKSLNYKFKHEDIIEALEL